MRRYGRIQIVRRLRLVSIYFGVCSGCALANYFHLRLMKLSIKNQIWTDRGFCLTGGTCRRVVVSMVVHHCCNVRRLAMMVMSMMKFSDVL